MNSFKFTRNPALRIILLAIPGFLFGFLPPVQYYLFTYYTIIILFTLAVLLSIRKKYIISFMLLCFCSGLWIASGIINSSIQKPKKIIPEFPALLEGRVTKVLNNSGKSLKCIVNGEFDAKMLPRLSDENILLNIYKLDNSNLQLKPGIEIAAIVQAHVPKESTIPTDFPEDGYAASLDIQWIARAPATSVSILQPPNGLISVREDIINEIEYRINRLFSENQNIIIALVTGDQSQIPKEIRNNFSLSGTAHVLSVSGLHVGIISMAIFLFLGFIGNGNLKFILFVLLVAAFIFLTGMQPSAIRAGFMSILVYFAYQMQREINPLNILLLALYLLIIASPTLLLSAGFQMSAMSMMGITIFYPRLNKSLKSVFNNKDSALLNFVISSISLSISASIAISPLVAYYFNTFSIISPLSNLFVVPLMSLAMIFSLLSLILSFISYDFASVYAVSAGVLTDITININSLAISLPYSYLKSGSTFVLTSMISISLIYLIYSSSFRQLAFRIMICTTCIFMFAFMAKDRVERKLEIIPRDQYVAVFMHVNDNKTAVLLYDRKPHQYPSRDIAMEAYLSRIKDTLVIGINGNAGMKITDKIKAVNNPKVVMMKANLLNFAFEPYNKSIVNISKYSTIKD